MLEVARAENAGAAADPAALIDDAETAEAVRRVSPIVLAPRRGSGEDVIAPMLPAPFINPAVVHRTAALGATLDGRPAVAFRYREGIALEGGRATLPLRWSAAGALTRDAGGTARAHAREPRGPAQARGRARPRHAVAPASARPPTGSRAGRWGMAVDARTAERQREYGRRVHGEGHPGYLATARMLGEAGHPAGRGRRDAAARRLPHARARARERQRAALRPGGRALVGRLARAPTAARGGHRALCERLQVEQLAARHHEIAGRQQQAHRQPRTPARSATRSFASSRERPGASCSTEYVTATVRTRSRGEQRDRAPRLELDEPEDLHHALAGLEALEPAVSAAGCAGRGCRGGRSCRGRRAAGTASGIHALSRSRRRRGRAPSPSSASRRREAAGGAPAASSPTRRPPRPAHPAAGRSRALRSSSPSSHAAGSPRSARARTALAPHAIALDPCRPDGAAARRRRTDRALAASMAEQIERERRLPDELVRELLDGGLLGLCLPRALGGRRRTRRRWSPRSSGSRAATARRAWCAMIGSTSCLLGAYLPRGGRRPRVRRRARDRGRRVRAARPRRALAGRLPRERPLAVRERRAALRLGDGRLRRAQRRRARAAAERHARRAPDADAGREPGGARHLVGRGPARHGQPRHERRAMCSSRPRCRASVFSEPPRARGPALPLPAVRAARARHLRRRARRREGRDRGADRARGGQGPAGGHADARAARRPSSATSRRRRRCCARRGRSCSTKRGAAWEAARRRERSTPSAGSACASRRRTRRARAAAVATAMYEAGGGSSIYDTNPLQRRFRDVHVATQHMMVAPATSELAGRLLLGVPTRHARSSDARWRAARAAARRLRGGVVAAVDGAQPDVEQRVDDARPRRPRGPSPAKLAWSTRSFIQLSAIARSRAAASGRRRAARALAFDRLGRFLHEALHHARPQLAHLGAARPRLDRGERDGPVGAERVVDVVCSPSRSTRRGSSARQRERDAGADLLDEAVEQRQQHRLLGGEVEVEGRPRYARAAREVVDGDVVQRALPEQALSRLEDRAFALLAAHAGTRRPRAGLERAVTPRERSWTARYTHSRRCCREFSTAC